MSNKMYMQDGKLVVPDHVVIPFIEGDGVGAEITPVCQKIVNTAVELAYVGKRRIEWKEVLAGGKAFEQTGEWLPEATLEAFKEYLVGIKGPLTTPVGGGIRSLNVALRQTLDLVCLPASGTLVQRSRFSGERAAQGEHAHFPRKYGRHLCGYRMGTRYTGSTEILCFPS